MTPDIRISRTMSNIAAIRRAVDKLTKQDVYVGIPEDKAAREAAGDTGISNAYLAYIHEHGVPEKNIPARPALIPGIQDIQAEAVAILKEMAKKALEGNAGAVDSGLNRIGLLGQNAVRARFVNNDWQALKDATLDRRKVVSTSVNEDGETEKRYGKSRRERGAVNPLIDTGELRKRYTYVVREKGNSALVVR